MLNFSNKTLLGFAAVAGLQTAAISWMVSDRITLLKTGKEVVLPIIPVDPRSLFRGDYVRIDFPVTLVPAELFPKADKPKRAAPVYVTVQRDGESWKPVAVGDTKPVAGPEQAVMLGRLAHNWWPTERGPGRGPSASIMASNATMCRRAKACSSRRWPATRSWRWSSPSTPKVVRRSRA